MVRSGGISPIEDSLSTPAGWSDGVRRGMSFLMAGLKVKKNLQRKDRQEKDLHCEKDRQGDLQHVKD